NTVVRPSVLEPSITERAPPMIETKRAQSRREATPTKGFTPPRPARRATEEEDVSPATIRPRLKPQGLNMSRAPMFSPARALAPFALSALALRTQLAPPREFPRREPIENGNGEASAVHVTIGRVEVRAVMSTSMAPQRHVTKKPSAHLSLDEYLKERNR